MIVKDIQENMEVEQNVLRLHITELLDGLMELILKQLNWPRKEILKQICNCHKA